ncbi:MAG: hypothetical protein ABIA93_03380 [Candidatus Woesearchaeota archaeon]
MRRGQVSMEFIILLGMLIVILMSFMGVLATLTQDKLDEKGRELMLDLGRSVQSELILAAEVEPGYTRRISIPEKLEGIPVNVSNDNKTMYVKAREVTMPFNIPFTTSLFVGPGTYELKNVAGVLVMNKI